MDIDKIAEITNEFAELVKDQKFAQMIICKKGKFVQVETLPDEVVEEIVSQQWSEFQHKHICRRNGVEIYFASE